jgi:transcriptional regulator with XRE-family HTH domain
LANKIGYSLGFLNNLELGKRRLNEDVLKKLCEALDCSMSDILGESASGVLSIPYYNNAELIYKTLQSDLNSQMLENLLVFKATDNSMDEAIKENDIVILDKTINSIENIKTTENPIFLIEINGKIQLRKIRYNEIKETFSIISNHNNNPDYSDIPQDTFKTKISEKRIIIIGKIIKIIASR